MFSSYKVQILVIAAIFIFTVSCASSDNAVEPEENSKNNTCPDVPTVYYEGKTYNTVQI